MVAETIDGVSRFTCKICNSSLASRTTFMRHFRIHTRDQPPATSNANTSSATPTTTVNHSDPPMLVDSNGTTENRSPSEAAGTPSSINSIDSSEFLMSQVTKEIDNHGRTRYICNLCSASISNFANFKRHYRTFHSTEKSTGKNDDMDSPATSVNNTPKTHSDINR